MNSTTPEKSGDPLRDLTPLELLRKGYGGSQGKASGNQEEEQSALPLKEDKGMNNPMHLLRQGYAKAEEEI